MSASNLSTCYIPDHAVVGHMFNQLEYASGSSEIYLILICSPIELSGADGLVTVTKGTFFAIVLLLVAMHLFLVAMPFAPSSVLAPSSKARSP